MFPTMGHRVWFAWKCLPRDPKGNPPTWRELEDRVGLTNGSLYKATWDIAKRPGFDQLEKLALALETTPEWLQHERGDGPRAAWPIEPRPAPPAGALRLTARRRNGGLGGTRAEATFNREAPKLEDRQLPSLTGRTRK